MHQREHNIIPTGRRWSFIALTVLTCLTTAVFTYPENAFGASIGKLMSLPGFVNLIGAIARTNMAMQQAAENPQDTWRRQAVHDAVAAMPAAIIGLAAEFQAGKLKNEDLPGVQAMLGGFIDVNAADGYKKFMNHPDKSLIPKTGDGFPQDLAAQAVAGASGSSSDPSSAGTGTSVASEISAASSGVLPETPIPSSQMVSLENGNVGSVASGFSYDSSPRGGSATGSGDTGSSSVTDKTGTGTVVNTDPSLASLAAITGDTSTVGGALSSAGLVSAPSAAVDGKDSQSAPSSPDSTGTGLSKDLSSELSSVQSRIIPAQEQSAEREKEQNGFFKKSSTKDDDSDDQEEDPAGVAHVKRKHTQDAKDELRKGVTGKEAKSEKFHLMVKPKYWSTNPLVRVVEEALLERVAHAEGDDDQGGDGSKAAEILMGLAAIIAAIAPIVAAAIQADADKKIAKINADAAEKQTEITADTSKYMANKQEEIALNQANIAKNISQQNNDAQTKRLDNQLAELRSARQDARSAEEEKQNIEKQYNQERIDLAQKQSNDNLKLAKETLDANLTQAGLTSGFTNAQSSSARLSVASVSRSGKSMTASGAGSGSSSSSGGMGGGLAAGANAGVGGPGGPGGGAGGAGLGIKVDGELRGIVDTKVAANSQAGVNSAKPGQKEASAQQELLNGLKSIESKVSVTKNSALSTAPILRGVTYLRSQAVARQAGTNTIGRDLQALLEKNLFARGSTATRRVRSLATTKEPTDLSRFMERTKILKPSITSSEQRDGGFAGFVGRKKPSVVTRASEPVGRAHAQVPLNGAYNAPDTTHSNEMETPIQASAGLFENSTHGGH